MFLYFNGDSHTEGAGLADADMFPDYPGDFAPGQFKLFDKSWIDKRQSHVDRDSQVYFKMREANLRLAYPARIQQLLNCEIYNGAVGGSGMFATMVRTMYDLEKFVEEDRIPNQVIIGLTTKERLGIPNDQDYRDDVTVWVQTAMPVTLSHLDPKFQKFATAYWTSHSDEQLLILFLYQCLSIKYTVKSITGKDPIFVNTSSIWEKTHDLAENTNNSMLKSVWKLLNFDTIIKQTSLQEIGFRSGQVADGHFVKEAHTEYAKYLVNHIL